MTSAAAAPPHAKSLAPREHGAWAMLLQPFVGALLALWTWSWAYLPALACILIPFLMREPLLVVARQRWVWKTPHPETGEAARQLGWQVALLVAGGAALALVWPWWLLVGLGAAVTIFTAFSTYVTIRNAQRGIGFQVLSAAAMSSTVLIACLAVSTGQIPSWAWWWWGLHAVHFLTGILVVHVRLDARIAARRSAEILTPEYLAHRRRALVIQSMITAGAVVLLVLGDWFYAAALLISSAVHYRDLASAHRPREIALPMNTVGKRALALSIAFTGILILGTR